MVYNGKPYKNVWFGGPTPIFWNTHLDIFCIFGWNTNTTKVLPEGHLEGIKDFWDEDDFDDPLGGLCLPPKIGEMIQFDGWFLGGNVLFF